ncbi:MAG TPA: aminotransferase class I/II-fold pyridoxal phosphate-dependent enzyme [Gammaproteobacteria bacterium]|jgi:histidinol-phosphate aminotransferase|nr:aminotransferase class I/II-fold pyridoxal phosphate-dependent enzyme [Gammaproteobacteria bacterium]
MATQMTISAKSGLVDVDYYMVGISQLPGIEKPIKLSSNESVLGMSPAAQRAATGAIATSNLYLEFDTQTLAEVLGAHYSLMPDAITFGPGSDELLQRIVNAFCGPGEELVHSKNAYMQFPIYAKVAGATPIAADDNDLRYDVDSIINHVTDKTRVVLIANPDNPSGTYLTSAEIRRLHENLPSNVLLVVDAAYEEFAAAPDYESATQLVHEFENVIVTRTFSKVYGMAGLRLGWCYGPTWIIDLLTRIGPSFPVNSVAFAAGIEAIKDQQHVREVLNHNRFWINEMAKSFQDINLKVYPSQTNFLLVGFPSHTEKTADEVNRYLNQNGIIPRQFSVNEFKDKLRFTVGHNDGMNKTIQLMNRFFEH